MGQKKSHNGLSLINNVYSNRVLLFVTILILQPILGGKAGFPKETRLTSSENPSIEFIFVPTYGSSIDLIGRVHNVEPNDYKVAVYIFVEGSGWWTKPTFSQPLTPIQSDSIWTTDITTGGSDIFATKVRAFLMPNGIDPPLSRGLPCLPAAIDTLSVADVDTMRSPRIISFSGYEWRVKTSVGAVGPGPNFFSDSMDNVWVDEQDQLHLRITNRNGKWYCSEVVLNDSLGYGGYLFKVTGKIGAINENVVLGLFTWDNDACEEFHREIDIEFSRWGVVTDPNAQYVVQPYTTPGNRYRWTIPPSLELSTHVFEWTTENISFQSIKGHDTSPSSDSVIQSWNYSEPNIPIPEKENVRINLWLNNGQPPSDNSEVEVIIARFEFDVITSVKEPEVSEPQHFSLSQNYPNPFNATTRIAFSLSKTSPVTLKVYDIIGREIAVLVNERKVPGDYIVLWEANNFPSGIYFYELVADGLTKMKKTILLK